MIKKIIIGITELLKEHFVGINVYSNDIKTGYNCPCFFIDISNIKTEKLTAKIDILSVNLIISYVNEDEIINQIESLETSEKLRNALLEKTIKVDEGISFQIYENSIEIEDNYISIEFDVEMQLIKDIEEHLPFMEEISIQ